MTLLAWSVLSAKNRRHHHTTAKRFQTISVIQNAKQICDTSKICFKGKLTRKNSNYHCESDKSNLKLHPDLLHWIANEIKEHIVWLKCSYFISASFQTCVGVCVKEHFTNKSQTVADVIVAVATAAAVVVIIIPSNFFSTSWQFCSSTRKKSCLIFRAFWNPFKHFR